MTRYARVGKLLNLPVSSDRDMERLIMEDALTARYLFALVEHLETDKALQTRIGTRIVALSTWKRLKKNQGRVMSRGIAERVARVARITAYAEDVWGDTDLARDFMLGSQRQLDDRAPLDVTAGTEVGAYRVETILARIEHGIPA